MEAGNNGNHISLLAKKLFWVGWSSGHITYNTNKQTHTSTQINYSSKSLLD